MTEHDDERIVSRRYRELPHEEPAQQLDEAIRARARGAGDTVPAPLVAPTGRSRWYFPVAAAAILVLAVAVTWHIEREQPDAYVASAPEPTAPPPKAAEAPAPQEDAGARRKVESALPQARDSVALARKPQREEAAAPAARSDEARPPLGAAARSEIMAERAFAETPERMLERIAKLRAEGRHDEADKALAEFRKRYPEFRIPPEVLQKVEKR